eukprot:m.79801 g.79801  ORF g.79801 m.79801 type:complete len:64 (+) comp10843_c1_seq2:211-402(+)
MANIARKFLDEQIRLLETPYTNDDIAVAVGTLSASACPLGSHPITILCVCGLAGVLCKDPHCE